LEKRLSQQVKCLYRGIAVSVLSISSTMNSETVYFFPVAAIETKSENV
jgi:hypothetical protein